MTPNAAIVRAATVTKLGPDVRGAVLVSGSHGGLYAAYLAAKAKPRAIMLFDAGGGKESAGIACLEYGAKIGLAAATIGVMTARIGDADDAMHRGVISHANSLAQSSGCHPGMAVADAANALRTAPLPTNQGSAVTEARRVVGTTPGGRNIVCIDSASLVKPEDAGQIVVTGSHGGLVGGNPAMALQVDAAAALYSDAGIGIDDAGCSRLSALDTRNIAAATVGTMSARIGDAVSILEEGVLSRVNETARNRGALNGMSAREFVTLF